MKSILKFAGLLLVSALMIGLIVHNMPVNASSTAFTLTSVGTAQDFKDGTPQDPRIWKIVTEAVRSDGSWVRKTTTYHGSEGPSVNREIFLRAGNLHRVASDGVRAQTTTRADHVYNLTAYDPAINCKAPGLVWGEDKVLDLNVFTYRSGTSQVWVSPDLGCAVVKATNSSPGIINTTVAQSYKLGNPDPALFDTAGYTEMPPSQRVRLLFEYRQQHTTTLISPPKTAREADEHYYRTRVIDGANIR